MRMWAMLFLAAVVGLCGCSNIANYEPKPLSPKALPEPGLVETSYSAAQAMAGQLKEKRLGHDRPIMLTSLVSIDNLQQTSSFGRVVAEQISARLSQLNFEMVELKARRNSVAVREGEGEFALSRDIEKILYQRDAEAVLTGTYSVTDTKVYVSPRIIRWYDKKVLAAYDYVLDLTPEIAAMLPREQMPEGYGELKPKVKTSF